MIAATHSRCSAIACRCSTAMSSTSSARRSLPSPVTGDERNPMQRPGPLIEIAAGLAQLAEELREQLRCRARVAVRARAGRACLPLPQIRPDREARRRRAHLEQFIFGGGAPEGDHLAFWVSDPPPAANLRAALRADRPPVPPLRGRLDRRRQIRQLDDRRGLARRRGARPMKGSSPVPPTSVAGLP
jgi:hypothetical protein